MVVTNWLGLGLREDAHARLELDEVVLTWGETLTGRLVLAGRLRLHRVTEPLHAHLYYSWDDETRALDKQVQVQRLVLLPRPHFIEPGTVRHFPLGFTIPTGTPFQASVGLSVDIHSGIWRQTVGYSIQVVPPVLCVMIAQQFAELTGMFVQGWEVTSDGEISARLVAAGRRALFRKAQLELSDPQIPNRVRLTVVSFHPQRGSQERKGDLRLCDPDPARIREQFSNLLLRNGFRPGGLHDLPLPAGLPSQSSADLPLPAADSPQHSTTD